MIGLSLTAQSQIVWDSSNVGGTPVLNDIAFTSVVGYAVGDSGTIAKTTDGGRTWSSQTVDPLRSLFVVSFVDSLHGCVAGTGIARYTTDGGSSWLPPMPPFHGVGSPALAWGNHSICVGVGIGGQIMRTTDGGRTWTAVVTGTGPSMFGVAFSDSACAVAVGNHKMVRSTDAGQTWSLLWSPAATLWDVTSPLIHRLVGVGMVSASEGVVYRSTDDGLTWDSLRLGKRGYLRSVSFPSPDTGFALSSAGTIYQTIDGGVAWDSITALPLEASVGNMAVLDPRTIYFSGVRGNVFRSSHGLTGSIPELRLPSVAALDQNFPNPFNPSTVIRFRLAERSAVRLSVFTALGQDVATLCNEVREQGDHEIVFQAHGLASGIYFYQLQAGTSRITRQLVIIR